LVDSLRKAYSAEKAASFADIGHAGSLKDSEEVSGGNIASILHDGERKTIGP
jgi:hypothetical protein